MADPVPTVTIRVRYFAGAKAAAGVAEESVDVQAGSTISDVLMTLGTRHGEALERVLTAASYLVDGVAVRDKSNVVTERIRLDVLPPFAGG
ncbi:MAG: MoaD/ThiS family protein [Stackebrandtia sp.]